MEAVENCSDPFTTMNENRKPDLLVWMASLAPTDSRLDAIDAIRRGESLSKPEEDYLSLKEVAAAVRKHPSYLWKLGLPKHCGVRLAGSYRYKKSEVIAFLKSRACAGRVAELHAARVSREADRKTEIAA